MTKYAPSIVVQKYVKHQLRSHGRHGIHSPFIFRLSQQLSRPLSHYESEIIQRIEKYRKTLEKDDLNISFLDQSSGRPVSTTIGNIARNSAISSRRGRKLALLQEHIKPDKVLELGTSLGMSAAYQNAFYSIPEFRSIEGNDYLQPCILKTFSSFVPNGKSYIGRFGELLPVILKEFVPDFCFVDGDHTYQATVQNVQALLNVMPSNGVIVLDDIHWSMEMEKAWNELKQAPEVCQSVDMFFLGILFLDPTRSKETFNLRW